MKTREIFSHTAGEGFQQLYTVSLPIICILMYLLVLHMCVCEFSVAIFRGQILWHCEHLRRGRTPRRIKFLETGSWRSQLEEKSKHIIS